MSQMTVLRPASRSLKVDQWWHLRIGSNLAGAADGIIKELISPLSACAQQLGAGCWYFGRNDAPKSSVVWLRVLARPAVITQLRSLQAALCLTMGTKCGVLTFEHQFKPAADEVSYLRDTAQDPQREAEIMTFGGMDGLNLAQEVFEVASELAVWGTQRFATGHNRMALAALLLFDSAYAMRQGKHSARWTDRRRISWDSYWDAHLRSCTAHIGTTNGVRLREALTSQVYARSQLMHSIMTAMSAEAAVKNWRRRWHRAIDFYLYYADKKRVCRRADHLTVLQSHHLTKNLGFTTVEEGILGLYARVWESRF